MIGKGSGRFRNRRMNRDYLADSIFKIGLDTGKSCGNPRRLGVSQTFLKYHQLE